MVSNVVGFLRQLLLLSLSCILQVCHSVQVFIHDLFQRLVVERDCGEQLEQNGPSVHALPVGVVVGALLVHTESLGVVFLGQSASFQHMLVILHDLLQPDHIPLDIFALLNLQRQELEEPEKIVGWER